MKTDGLTPFSHIFLINLSHREDRLAQASEELSREGIEFEVYPGAITLQPKGLQSIGARGCYLSHLFCIAEAKKRGYESVLILEDDVVLRHNFRKYWSQVTDWLHVNKWDLFYAYDWANKNQFSPPEEVKIVEIEETPCCHFWGVHHDAYNYAIKKLIESDNNQLPIGLDQIFAGDRNLKRVATSYNLAGQRVNESDTASRWQNQAKYSAVNGIHWHG